MEFDEFLIYIGEFGKYQKKFFVLVCLPIMLTGIQIMASIFILAVPAHRCALPGFENDTYALKDIYHEYLVDLYIPLREHEGILLYSKCTRYDLSAVTSNNGTNTTADVNRRVEIQCDRWVYDHSEFTSTVATEINLVCDRSLYVAHATTALYVGSLIAFLTMGHISDRFGRKKAYFLELLVLGVFSTLSAWLPNIYVFSAFRFMVGFGYGGFYTVAFVYSMEHIGPSKRTVLGILINNFWGFGLFIHAALAYFIRDWRYLQLATAVPHFIFIVYWWVFSESPRWLLAKGRTAEGTGVLKKMAKTNNANLPELGQSDLNVDVENTDAEDKGNFLDLFRSRKLATTSVVVYFNWLVVAMMYYGLSLGVGNLGGNLYLNYFLTSLVEFFGYLVCIPALHRVGRKVFHAGCMILAGLALILVIFPENYSTNGTGTLVLSLIGKFGASAAFATIFLFSTELFPTVVRSSALGTSAFFCGVGTMIAPYIVQLASILEGHMATIVPLLVFGSCSIAAGGLAFLLPETRNRHLPDGIKDMEKMSSFQAA